MSIVGVGILRNTFPFLMLMSFFGGAVVISDFTVFWTAQS